MLTHLTLSVLANMHLINMECPYIKQLKKVLQLQVPNMASTSSSVTIDTSNSKTDVASLLLLASRVAVEATAIARPTQASTIISVTINNHVF